MLWACLDEHLQASLHEGHLIEAAWIPTMARMRHAEGSQP